MPAMYWLILGLVLIVLDLFNPGGYLLWLGAGALATALLGWLGLEMNLVWQVVVFGALSLAAILAYREWRRRNPRIEASDRPLLNQRAAQRIGEVHVLVEPLHDGRGRLKIGDTYWVIHGPDMPVGTRVRVIGTDGIDLSVEDVAAGG